MAIVRRELLKVESMKGYCFSRRGAGPLEERREWCPPPLDVPAPEVYVLDSGMFVQRESVPSTGDRWQERMGIGDSWFHYKVLQGQSIIVISSAKKVLKSKSDCHEAG
eukprot:scaffold64721_cov22-Cyclotella_meneghiniana.AAC.1